MNSTERLELAQSLAQAYVSGQSIEPAKAAMTAEDAYAVQHLQVETWVSEGRSLRGYKVGITSRVAQAALGVDEPDYGHLFDDMIVPSGSALPFRRLFQPRVEPEVAFILSRELCGPGVTEADVGGATAFVVPALEIIDSRIRDWKVRFVDTIADNGSSGMVALGSRPVPLQQLDLSAVECCLYSNGDLAQTGNCTAVLGNPVSAVVWLANTLGASGVSLASESVVMSGTWTQAIPASPGDRVRADFSGIGSVVATFQ